MQAAPFCPPAGRPVRWSTLSTLDKDLLQDALQVVKRFKRMINQRYGLDRF